MPDLTEIVARFRRWRYGLTAADITKAFLQINMHITDQYFHRFFGMSTIRFRRVIFGVSSDPFLLNATMKIHLSKFEPTNTLKELENNFCVDDWLTGADSEQEINEMMREAEKLIRLRGFSLKKLASNCQGTKDEFSKNLYGLKDKIKVSGLTRITVNECFGFHTSQIDRDCLITKRCE